MNYVLDTNILIEIRKGRKDVKDEIMRFINAESAVPYITLLTFAEYYFGSLDASHEGQEDCLAFLSSYRHLTIAKSSAMLFAKLTYKYEKEGTPLSPLDMLNACITIDNNFVFITADKAFERVKELKKIIVSL